MSPWALSGLCSATDSTTGTTISNNMYNVETDIVQGRKSLSAWDDGAKQWQAKGGNKIREEYEAQYAGQR